MNFAGLPSGIFFRRIAIPVLLAFALPAGSGAAEPSGPGIISHETEVVLRQPERVTRVPRVTSAGLPASEATVPEKAAFPELDVYSLSPCARFLAPDHAFSAPGSDTRASRSGWTSPPLPSAEWRAIIDEASEIFGLDQALIASVIRVESRYRAQAESPAGAQGAMQIMPGTQIDLGLIDPFDARANVYAGSQYLRMMLDRFGRLDLALAAYNAGPGNVEKYGGVPPFRETRDFVNRVLAGL